MSAAGVIAIVGVVFALVYGFARKADGAEVSSDWVRDRIRRDGRK